MSVSWNRFQYRMNHIQRLIASDPSTLTDRDWKVLKEADEVLDFWWLALHPVLKRLNKSESK